MRYIDKSYLIWYNTYSSKYSPSPNKEERNREKSRRSTSLFELFPRTHVLFGLERPGGYDPKKTGGGPDEIAGFSK